MRRRSTVNLLTAFATVASWAVPRPVQAASQIYLQGVVAANCTIVVTAYTAASALPLSSVTPQRILVGSIVQNCNKPSGYTLVVGSANCPAATPGAKVTDAVSGESVPYSVEFNNPTTGGSRAVVAGLLASTCLAAIGRDVLNSKIVNEASSVFVNYTGSVLLAAGTYQDTLTITLNLK